MTEHVAYLDKNDENLFVYTNGKLKHQVDTVGFDVVSLGHLLEDLGVPVRHSDAVFGASAEEGTFEPLPTLEAIEQWEDRELNRLRTELGREVNRLWQEVVEHRQAARRSQERMRIAERDLLIAEGKLEELRVSE